MPPAPIQTTVDRPGAVINNPIHGITLMFLSTFFFAAMHAVIRYLTEVMHPFEAAFFRNATGLIFLLPWFLRYGLKPLHTDHFKLHLWRSLVNVVAMLCFFYAVSITPLAEVTALGFAAPIFATVLAALVLGETIRLRRWTAVVVGFIGTLIILRPGFAEVGLGQLLVMTSTVFWAVALLLIKQVSRYDSSITVIAYMSLLQLPLSLLPALFVWTWPSLDMVPWLLALGLLGGVAQWLMTESLRVADTSVVMPLDFCKLPWTALLAYLAFAQVPDKYTWIGGAVIFGSALYIAYRERQVQTDGRSTR
ncbi:MAG: DMT family transporter [Alphaproteobacteria bacterium]|nr:DMT family transporter [Alphaproteobacteria bacterium]